MSSVDSGLVFILALTKQVLIRLCCQILDELIIAGELQESSKKSVLRVVRQRGMPVQYFFLRSLMKWGIGDAI